MLDEKRMQRNRKWLEEERARLGADLQRIEAINDPGDRPGLSTHPADTASEVFEQAKNLAVRQSLRRTLDLVTKALAKMDQGQYGLCERCGQFIDPARLKALPQATLCMACQEYVERGLHAH